MEAQSASARAQAECPLLQQNRLERLPVVLPWARPRLGSQRIEHLLEIFTGQDYLETLWFLLFMEAPYSSLLGLANLKQIAQPGCLSCLVSFVDKMGGGHEHGYEEKWYPYVL